MVRAACGSPSASSMTPLPRAEKAGLAVVVDRCPAIELPRLAA